MKIVKFFKGIFSHPKICVYVFKGLVVAESSLKAAIEALKEQVPDFKHMAEIETVLKYISLVRSYLGSFVSIFGVDIDSITSIAVSHEEAVQSLSADGEATSSIAEISKHIPERL